MPKRRYLSVLLAAVLTGAVLLSGSLSVHAEPTEEIPAVEPSGDVTEVSFEIPNETSMEQPSVPEPEPIPEPVPEPIIEPSPEPTEVSDWPVEYSVPVEPEPSEIMPPEISYEIPLEVSYDEPSDTEESYEYSYAEISYVWSGYDDYEYTQELYGYEEVTGEYDPDVPQRDTSALEISDYEMSDVKTLTSEDWESLKQARQQTSQFEMKQTAANKKSAFGKLKQDSKGGNDDWIFLVWGIGLIVAGIAAVTAVVFTSRHTKKRKR